MIKSNLAQLEENGLYNEKEETFVPQNLDEHLYVQINFLFKSKVQCIKITNLTD